MDSKNLLQTFLKEENDLLKTKLEESQSDFDECFIGYYKGKLDLLEKIQNILEKGNE